MITLRENTKSFKIIVKVVLNIFTHKPQEEKTTKI